MRTSGCAAGTPLRHAATVVLASVAALCAAGCAAHRFTIPTAAPAPVAPLEAAAAWAEATRLCGAVTSYNAELRPSGRLAGQRVRGVTLLVAADATGRVGVEAAVSGGSPLFRLGGTADRATLWLPRERRVVTDTPSRILGALVGIDVEPERLLAILSGCGTADRAAVRADRLGELLRVTTASAVAYIDRSTGAWRLRAVEGHGLLVDYRAFDDEGWPSTIGIRTAGTDEPSVDLSLDVGVRVINPALGPLVFQVRVPSDAVPASVDDLRPLGTEE